LCHICRVPLSIIIIIIIISIIQYIISSDLKIFTLSSERCAQFSVLRQVTECSLRKCKSKKSNLIFVCFNIWRRRHASWSWKFL